MNDKTKPTTKPDDEQAALPKIDVQTLATRIRELFKYSPRTGLLTRRVRTSHRTTVGEVAGNLSATGRIQLQVDRHMYAAHRLIWLYMTGDMPKMIDHRDGDPTNNRWKNLRLADATTNQWNKRTHKNNRSGLKGVYRSRSPRALKKWRARICIDKKQQWLGSFATKQEAHAAYAAAAKNHFGQFARTI